MCNYVTSRNGYCKRIMTLTSESKHIFRNHKVHEKKMNVKCIYGFS